MCVQEAEQVNKGIDESPRSENDAEHNNSSRKKQTLGMHCVTHMEDRVKDSDFITSSGALPLGTSFPVLPCVFEVPVSLFGKITNALWPILIKTPLDGLESISEDGVTERRQGLSPNFVPTLQSGEWSDIGGRCYMEDTHICISDLAKNFGCSLLGHEAVSFYGVFDGHGGESAAQFVRDHLPRVIVEDADFPLELEKVVTRSFIQTDTAFAQSCSHESYRSSGTTALTALIFGRSLLVANAGDCRAVLSQRGVAIEMSKDHRPCCNREKRRIESLGGYVSDGYLNGQLGVTRALGDWHLEGLKEKGGPLSAEPELKLITLTKEDEYLIIGSDGIWDVFTSQNAVDFSRRRLQEHNDVKLCCKEMVEEAIKRGAMDNLTVVMVSFHMEPPPPAVIPRTRFRRSISAEGLENLRSLLQV